MRTMGVIPARYQSQRLPGKVLLDIAGKPMVQRVYESALQAGVVDELLVATDSPLVEEVCRGASIPVMLTGEHPSGSDRLYEVMTRTSADLYVNIQGDEPMVRAEHLRLLLAPFAETDAEVTTLKVRISASEAANPNVVKVVTGHQGKALYFSRNPIPFDRDGSGQATYYKHIGLYAFTRKALESFHQLSQSSLEIAEKLEQLRLLENGLAIYVSETDHDTVGVDTQEDLERVNAEFRRRAAT